MRGKEGKVSRWPLATHSHFGSRLIRIHSFTTSLTFVNHLESDGYSHKILSIANSVNRKNFHPFPLSQIVLQPCHLKTVFIHLNTTLGSDEPSQS